jgi:hypothetical protein
VRRRDPIVDLLSGLLNGLWKLGGGKGRAPFWLFLLALSVALYAYYRFVMSPFE